MSKPKAGAKIPNQNTAELVASFREAYEIGSPAFRQYVDRVRKPFKAKRYAGLSQEHIDELICTNLLQFISPLAKTYGNGLRNE